MQIQNTNSNAKYSALVRIGMGLGFDTQSCEGGHGLSWHLANWSTHACKKQSIEPNTFFNVHKYISIFKQIYLKKKIKRFWPTSKFGQIHFTMYTNTFENLNKYILQIDPPMPARSNQLGLTKSNTPPIRLRLIEVFSANSQFRKLWWFTEMKWTPPAE